MPDFDDWFKCATGNSPFPYQRQFAAEDEMPELVNVPTGLGKTAMAVLGWSWRRRFATEEIRQRTPRRLLYCLPMRVLVEQTYNNTVLWLHNLGLLAGSVQLDGQDGHKKLRSYTLDFDDPEKVAVHILMGGEDEEDWDIYPERDQIIIGTQDMLLSRAINRGYAASRSRWPIQFGLLNTDCLWIFDEIQLMGSGLATTAQLEAFRRLLPGKGQEAARNSHGCRSVWMSATMQRDWLETVDFKSFVEHAQALSFHFEKEIAASQLDDTPRKALQDRWEAKKPLKKAETAMGNAVALAEEILREHRQGTRTIVVVNTVKRACELYDALKKGTDAPMGAKPGVVLLHSRFRPADRKRQVDRALSEPDEAGMIVVSTQVIEAGVDVSATTLFTELAPWASLVQRFGRCNRRGQDNANAAVHWITMPARDADAKNVAAPYRFDDLEDAEKRLKKLTDVGLRFLPADIQLPFEHVHIIRRRDLIDLFDTTPDLAGNDIDIDRFVREVEDSDVRVFWRNYGDTPNETDDTEAQPAPHREELCPVPIGTDKNPGFRQFVTEHAGKVWQWSFLDRRWEKADVGKIAPGQVFLVHANAGGYTSERGWNPESQVRVEPLDSLSGRKRGPPDATDDERLSRIGVWQIVAEHTEEVSKELNVVIEALALSSIEEAALRHTARWHDRGKAHEVFQAALPEGVPDASRVWAKARGTWKRYGRLHFRHELASALSVLDPQNDKIPDDCRNLVGYLAAAHHGKVRLSIRSLPNESRPDGNRRFARGIWDNDELPGTDLGGGVTAPAVRLSLEPMELGLCEQEPFVGQPSWAERMIRLRDTLGPFRLAYLEAILRAADMRASRAAEQRGTATEISGSINKKEDAGND